MLQRTIEAYKNDADFRAATMFAPNAVNREMTKQQVLECLDILEKAILETEQRLYGIIQKQAVRAEGIPYQIQLNQWKASDKIYLAFGFDEADVRYNIKRLGLVEDQDFKALMAQSLATSDKWFEGKDEAIAKTVCQMRSSRLE